MTRLCIVLLAAFFFIACSADAGPAKASKTSKTMSKTSFEELNFNKASVTDVINTLTKLSDKSGNSANIILKSGKKKTLPLITFKARKISLREALNIVADLSGLKVRVRGSIVMLVPEDEPEENIVVKTFNVTPNAGQKTSRLRPESLK